MEGPSQPVEDGSPVEEVAAEELALCKAWVSASESSIEGNGKKASGFWTKVTEYFHNEMGEDKRTYDSVNCKWKNRIFPKVSQFGEIYNNVKDRHQSGACDTTIYQEAEIEYHAIFNAAFALTDCNSDSAHIGLNLNDEAADSEDVEVQEVAPMGRDRAKKKASSSGARSETSVAGDPSLVDALLSKFTMAATPFFSRGRNPPLSI
ncbi:hypothetical protein Tco_0622124 [Tanacetum coccineum]